MPVGRQLVETHRPTIEEWILGYLDKGMSDTRQFRVKKMTKDIEDIPPTIIGQSLIYMANEDYEFDGFVLERVGEETRQNVRWMAKKV